MSTLDNQTRLRSVARTGYVYLLISLFCAFFGAVYEHFSHEVYSASMIYAFAFPLAGGALPLLSMALFGCRRLPGRLTLNIFNSGIAALTAGSIMQGVLEIYGTANDLLRFYWFVGGSLAVAGILHYIFEVVRDRS